MVQDPLPTGTTAVAGSTVVTAPQPSPQNFRDDFESGGYSGSTGTLAWPAPWAEFNDDGLADRR